MFQIYEKEQNTLMKISLGYFFIYRIMENLFLRPFFLNKKLFTIKIKVRY